MVAWSYGRKSDTERRTDDGPACGFEDQPRRARDQIRVCFRKRQALLRVRALMVGNEYSVRQMEEVALGRAPADQPPSHQLTCAVSRPKFVARISR
jgi:hypothetical protein